RGEAPARRRHRVRHAHRAVGLRRPTERGGGTVPRLHDGDAGPPLARRHGAWRPTADRLNFNLASGVLEMKSKNVPSIVIIVVSLAVSGSMALAAPDRFTLRAPNGLAFSEIRGYDTWQDVAVSQTDDGL